jgi:hypothetical protein
MKSFAAQVTPVAIQLHSVGTATNILWEAPLWSD